MNDFWLGVAAFVLWCAAAVIFALAYHSVKALYLRHQRNRGKP